MSAPLSASSSSGAAAGPALRRTGFHVELNEVDTTVVLRLEGELDTATARELRAALDSAMAGEATAIVLDLAELSFIDSTGIGVFLAASHQAETRGRSFALRHPVRMVRKVLHLTGVDRLVTIEASEACTG